MNQENPILAKRIAQLERMLSYTKQTNNQLLEDNRQILVELAAQKELTKSANSNNQSLMAQVEALRKALNDQLNDCINFDGGKLTDAIMKHSSDLLATTPQQHLAEIRAEAGYRGWMECVRVYCTEEHFTPHPATGMTAIKGAHQYADSIRRGEVK